jgi:hypothetical protein
LIAVSTDCLIAGQAEIREVALRRSTGSTQVIVYLESLVQYKCGRLTGPERLYVDLFNTRVKPHVSERLASFHDALLSRVRIGQNESAARMVLDLNPAVKRTLVSMESDPPRLVIKLKGRFKFAPGDPASSGPELPPALLEAPALSSFEISVGAAVPEWLNSARFQNLPAETKPQPPSTATAPATVQPSPAATRPTKTPLALESSRILRIPRVSRAPKLQDFLIGTPREAEARITDFRQREPGDGVPATQKTTAYLSYDETNLYIVFECQDEPGKIRGRLVHRDAIADDDQVLVYLDTFHTRQRAYVFATNPLGIQQDGVVIEGEEEPDFSFDTLWYSEGRRTAQGYVVWMSIPFKSLRFSSAPVQTWGIALGRSVIRNSESSFWPYITQRIEGFVPQMGTLEGLEQISPGHNMEFIPYLTYIGSHYLDTNRPAYVSTERGRGGMDSKVVLKDALTLDVALNPDFSEVETNDPQVTVNQRYEVFFPEKRPFFLENASFFQTPINLFYSRHIADPQFGVRLTGTVDRWNIGVIAANDRAPGHSLDPSDPLYQRETDIGVLRIQHEFREQSNIGVLATSRDFGSSSNRVFSMDTRLKLSPNWVFAGQAMRTDTRNQDHTHLLGAGYLAELSYTGRHFTYSGNYTDLSPGFRSPLGYVRRVNIRQINHYAGYFWRPQGRGVLAFGPGATGLIDWDRKGVLQDWIARLYFTVYFKGQTEFKVTRSQSFELLSGRVSPTAGINPEDTVDTGTNAGGLRLGFRKKASSLEFSTAWLHWLGIATTYSQGTGVNNARVVIAGIELAQKISKRELQTGRANLIAAMRAGTHAEYKESLTQPETEVRSLEALLPPPAPKMDSMVLVQALIRIFAQFAMLSMIQKLDLLREALTEITVDGRTIASVTISGGYLGMGATTMVRSKWPYWRLSRGPGSQRP